MGGCLSVGPAPLLQPYEVETPPVSSQPGGAQSKYGQKRGAGWNKREGDNGSAAATTGGAGGKGRRRSHSKESRDGGSSHADRDRSKSRTNGGKASIASMTTSQPQVATPSSQYGLSRGNSHTGGENGASWKDGAAVVTATSATDAAVEEQELDDWQRGIVDILEEQSIQAYDMDMSMGPNLDRRYSNSMLGFSSQNGPVNMAALLDSPMGHTGRTAGAARQNRLLSGASMQMPPPEPNPTILVVDEHPSTRQIITKWLTSSKYTEISCASGNQAMDILVPPAHAAVHRVDLIICDVNVVAHAGQLLLDWVINHDVSISAIPVIVLSSNLPSQGLERLIRRGAWDVLHKPLNRAVFLNALATVFNTRRQTAFIDKLRATGDEYKARFYSKTRNIPSHVRASFATPGLSPIGDSRHALPTWSAQQQAPDRSPSPLPKEPSQFQPIQVLLIEQDEVRAALLRSWIETPAVSVRHVHTVQEAVPILREAQRAAIMAASSSSSNSSPVQHTNSLHSQPLMRSTSQGTEYPARPLGLGHQHSSFIHGQAGPPGVVSPTISPSQGVRSVLPTHGELARSSSVYVPGVPSPHNPRVSVFTQQLLPTLQQRSFGIELIVVGHDVLIPADCLSEDLATLGVEEDPPAPAGDTLEQLTTEEEEAEDTSRQEDRPSRHRSRGGRGSGEDQFRKTTQLSPVVGLAAAQTLIDLSLQPVWGKARRLPIVVVCEEDGPSPVAMAILKHVALTILNAPLSHGLVNRRMGLILALIEQNRQSLTLARRAHMYKGLLSNLIGSASGGAEDEGNPTTTTTLELPGSPIMRKHMLNTDREARTKTTTAASPNDKHHRMGSRSMSGTQLVTQQQPQQLTPVLTSHGSGPLAGPSSGSLVPRQRAGVGLTIDPTSSESAAVSPSPSRSPIPAPLSLLQLPLGMQATLDQLPLSKHKLSSRARSEHSPVPADIDTELANRSINNTPRSRITISPQPSPNKRAALRIQPDN